MNYVTEERLKRIKRLKLLDDDYAKIFFKNRDCVRLVVEIVLQKSIQIIHHETESVIEMIGGRNVEYDIFVLSNKEGIDIEIENSISRVIPMRISYHQAVMLTHLSKPGMDFKNMKDIIVIFICSFDPLGKGEPLYHIDSIIRETGEMFNERVRAILVNGAYISDDAVGKLMNDFRVTDPNDMHYELLKEQSKYYKETKGGIEHMCEIWEEERAEGREMAIIQAIKDIMFNLNLTIEQAMNALNVEEEKKESYKKLILQNDL